MAEQPATQSNATNTQKQHNNPNTMLSDTACTHGHTTFTQYVAYPGVANAAQLKADEILKQIDEDFAKVVKRIGAAKLKNDYKTYAAIMPKATQPS